METYATKPLGVNTQLDSAEALGRARGKMPRLNSPSSGNLPLKNSKPIFGKFL